MAWDTSSSGLQLKRHFNRPAFSKQQHQQPGREAEWIGRRRRRSSEKIKKNTGECCCSWWLLESFRLAIGSFNGEPNRARVPSSFWTRSKWDERNCWQMFFSLSFWEPAPVWFPVHSSHLKMRWNNLMYLLFFSFSFWRRLSYLISYWSYGCLEASYGWFNLKFAELNPEFNSVLEYLLTVLEEKTGWRHYLLFQFWYILNGSDFQFKPDGVDRESDPLFLCH